MKRKRRTPDNNTQHIKLDDQLYRLLLYRAKHEQRTMHNLILVILRKAVADPSWSEVGQC